ncbi:hypothetical protein APA_3249 [Pseudanabaena sp. lw0831]|nr:hypothetical protein APA_3249 [Pseudanabaena sp. lw0831]
MLRAAHPSILISLYQSVRNRRENLEIVLGDNKLFSVIYQIFLNMISDRDR